MTTLTVDLIPDGSDALAGAFLASAYHGGQFTALYALASSGSLELYTGEGLSRLILELRDAIACAESQDYFGDSDGLGALLAWCEDHERFRTVDDNDSL